MRPTISTDRLREDRVELANYIAHLRMEYLKRFADRRSIVDQYLGAAIHIHAHFAHALIDCRHNGVCLRLGRMESQIHPGRTESTRSRPMGEVSVPVYAGEPIEKLEIRSLVWLEPLDECDVFVGEMFETACPILLKELWLRIDRKLSAVLLFSRIDTGTDKNDVVQRGTQMKDDLANQEQPSRRFCPNIAKEFFQGALDLIGGQFVLRESGIEYTFPNAVKNCFQLRQLFFCPSITEVRLLKEAHLL
jgi:hypothetical protein